MMKKYTLFVLAVLIATIAGCSDKKAPSEMKVGSHPEGWVADDGGEHARYLNQNQYRLQSCATCHGQDFRGGESNVSCYTCHSTYPHPDGWVGMNGGVHASYLKENEYDLESCASCHGEDFLGGQNKVSCFTCHSGYPHPQGWVGSNGGKHAQFLKENTFNLGLCSSCHGEDFTGGESNVSCYTCHADYPHRDGWVAPGENSHGAYLKTKNYQLESCAACHGQDFQGGDSEVSCYTCHSGYPHKDGFGNPSSGNFHSFALKSSNWNLQECATCHGTAFDGPTQQTACITCHTQSGGPTACTTCHGNFAAAADSLTDPSIAPPQDLNDQTATSAAGVGAHQLHLLDLQYAKPVNCSTCHVVPQEFSSPAHIDQLPAEVQFSGLAVSANGERPIWDKNSLTCSNVYCHGNFVFKKSESSFPFVYTDSVITGNNPQVIWTQVDGSQLACGSCHDLPPKGHAAYPSCSSCHGSGYDLNTNQVDPVKHINGKIDVF